MKKICQYTYMVGGVLLVVGAALYITKWAGAPYLYLLGAFMFGAMQMLDRYTGNNFMLRRLRRQQILGAIALMLTGILMLTCKHKAVLTPPVKHWKDAPSWSMSIRVRCTARWMQRRYLAACKHKPMPRSKCNLRWMCKVLATALPKR